MTGRRWFLSIAAIGIGFAGFFLVRAASGDAVYYLYPNEAMERRARRFAEMQAAATLLRLSRAG